MKKQKSSYEFIILDKKKDSWLMNVLIAGDQLGNALAKGNPDNTISARIGYFNYAVDSFDSKYWRILEKIVNFTFKPIDGEDHCFQAYLNDKDEEFNDIDYTCDGILFFFVIFPCIPMFIIIRIIAFLKPKVKSKYSVRGIDLSFNECNVIWKKRKEALKAKIK